MDHRPHHSHTHPPRQEFDTTKQSQFLDLDADVFSDHLAAVLELTGKPAAHSVVDLGAGTGAGSRLLRKRYPDAAIICIDNDPQMLDLLRHQGFDAIEADLDQGFPTLTDAPLTAPVDLVWASSSLHHVAHPAQLLSGVRRALAPGGVLVVVELATLPSFLTDPREVLLESRCHAAAATEGWNHHPDWTLGLEAAGFGVVKSELSSTAPATLTARACAESWFARFLHLATLTADDRDALVDLLGRFSGDLEIAPRATRTVWVATADQLREQS